MGNWRVTALRDSTLARMIHRELITLNNVVTSKYSPLGRLRHPVDSVQLISTNEMNCCLGINSRIYSVDFEQALCSMIIRFHCSVNKISNFRILVCSTYTGWSTQRVHRYIFKNMYCTKKCYIQKLHLKFKRIHFVVH